MTRLTPEIIYKDLYENCPPAVWTEFTNELEAARKAYNNTIPDTQLKNAEKIAASKGKVNENLTYSSLLEDLLLGISRKRIAAERGVAIKVVESFWEELSLPPVPVELARRIKNLPGGTTALKKKVLRLQTIDVDKLNEEYESGIGLFALTRKYKTHQDNLRPLIKSLNISPQDLNKMTIEYLESKEESFYKNLYKKNKNWSLTDLENWIIESTHETLSRKAVREFFSKIGLTVDPERQNRARSIKSKTDKNTSYMKRQNAIKIIEKSSYKSVDNLTKQYCSNKAGTYSMIAKKLNEELSTNSITSRQLSKLIISNPNFEKRQSRTELIFIEEVKKALNLSEKEIVRQKQINSESLSSVDLYIPKLSLAFEFNGDYWHSDEVIKFNHGISAKEYHTNKVEKCAKEGIKLLFVWESDFEKKTEEILTLIRNRKFSNPLFHELSKRSSKSYSSMRKCNLGPILTEWNIPFKRGRGFYDCGNIIVRYYTSKESNYTLYKELETQGKELFTIYPWYDLNKVREYLEHRLLKTPKKIFARKCQVNSTTSLTRKDHKFIQDNHILGNVPFRRVRTVERLKLGDELLAIAVFVASKDPEIVELKRLVFAKGVSVPGGASRLVKSATKRLSQEGVSKIFTFSDNDLGGGTVYKTIGFNLVHDSKGDKIWFNPKTAQKFSNKSLYSLGADRLLRNLKGYTPYGIGDHLPSNKEIVQKWGFIPIIDSGYKRWELVIES